MPRALVPPGEGPAAGDKGPCKTDSFRARLSQVFFDFFFFFYGIVVRLLVFLFPCYSSQLSLILWLNHQLIVLEDLGFPVAGY